MENDFNKKNLQDKLSQVRNDIEFKNLDLQGKLKFVREQIKSKEEIISEGAKKYDVEKEATSAPINNSVEETNIIESEPVAESKKVTVEKSNIEKYIIEIDEYKFQEVFDDAKYLMQNDLNINNIEQKINEAEIYFDSMPDSNEKENLIKRINRLKKEIENYRIFGIINKDKEKENKNKLETPLSQEEFIDNLSPMDDKNIDQLEGTEILEKSDTNKKAKVKKLFKGINDIMSTIGKKTGKLVQMVRKIEQQKENNVEEKEDSNKRKNEVKKRAKNINKIREKRISEERRQKEKEENEEKDRKRKEENDKKKEERKAKKEKKKKEKEENIKRLQRFEGDWHFDEDFNGKERGNFFSKKIKKYLLNRNRKNLNKIYQNNIKPLNEKYFKDILGEENIKILRKLEGQEKINKEKEILENFIQNVKDAKEEIIARKNEFIDIRERLNLFKKYNLTEESYKNLEKELREIEKQEEKILEKNDLSKEEYERVKKERNLKKRNSILQNYGLTENEYQNLKKQMEAIESKAIHAKYGFSEKDYKNFSSKMEKEEEWNILKKYNLSLDLYERFKREEDQKDLLNKLNIKLNAEEKIQKIRNEKDKEIKANIERKRYSEYIEKDINYYKNRIKELEESMLPGYKEEIKRFKLKIKALNKIERIKLGKEVKKNIYENVSESVKERFKTLNSKEKFEKSKENILNNLRERGSATWDSFGDGTWRAFDKSLKSENFGEGVAVLGKEAGKGGAGFIWGLLKLFFGFGLDAGKLGYRYIKK